MLLNAEIHRAPQFVELSHAEFWTFIKAFSYSSEWELPSLTRRQRALVGLKPRLTQRFCEHGISRMEEGDVMVWDCDEWARFSHGTSSSRPRSGGLTYFIQAGDGPVKIGSTHGDPNRRLKELQTGSSEPLRLLGTLDGAEWERELHERFAEWRLHGEWFDADAPGLRELLNEARE